MQGRDEGFKKNSDYGILDLNKSTDLMSRLQEFITRIRNCKTMAEERAEYQKEMAVIRESFAKNEEGMRPRNVTKLLFINMSGQETNFGQMECLKLITGNTLIEKRIGYLGLTQLFHEKSELLMMATNRIRVDLAHTNHNLVGLALCVLSEICTPELANELHKEVLKCVSSASKFVKKKAILTSIKLLKKAPEYLSDFMAEVVRALDDKNHGVLLGVFAFLENVLAIDESKAAELVDLMPRVSAVYRQFSSDYNSEYEISGVQDPFLQVAILRFLRALRRCTDSPQFMKYYGEILVSSHDVVCARVSGNIKNGANAVLFECFQCFMTIPPNPNLSQYSESVLTKFVSVKDANSKYLSLFNLTLMAKHDLEVAKRYRGTIIECLEENDILIRVMALDLLYVIASPDNVSGIIKELLNVLLTANDEEFISELALRICLIVEKYSQSRRWQFDTILKVLILADRFVKEESAKSLVHLITSTPELQEYCLAKLFFSASQNPQISALCQVTIYLLGELAPVLLRLRSVEVTQVQVVDLIEQVLFRANSSPETLEYGLSALFKLYDKFNSQKERILKIIRSFESHSDLEVQKRACEYTRLLDPIWNEDRVKEVCIPIPSMRAAADIFSGIPIGDTTLDLDEISLKMPEKLNINYDEHIVDTPAQKVEVRMGNTQGQSQGQPEIKKVQEQPKKRNVASLLEDDDEEEAPPAQVAKTVFPPVDNSDPFDILGLNIGQPAPTVPQHNPYQPQNQGVSLGGFSFDQPLTSSLSNVSNQGSKPPAGGLLDDDIFGTPTLNVQSSTHSEGPKSNGFDFLGGSTSIAQPQPAQPVPQNNNSFKFKAYENPQMEIWMEGHREGAGNTRITASFMNKTQSYIEQLSLQSAVMKYLKIAIQPLSGMSLPPGSKGAVTQQLQVNNSAVGEKPIVMKIKLGYSINGQKQAFEAKIDGFPLGF